jgi:hypothetical protein
MFVLFCCFVGYPHFKEATKSSSSCFKQKYHLIGALVHGYGPWIYTMSRYPADSNVTIEVLQRVLTDLSNESGGPLPKKLYLQLDNCGRENKNKAVMAYVSWLINRKIFISVEVSFLPVGHTHEDIDQVWSRTSIAMKSKDVSCEAELFPVIREAFHHYGYEARCGSLDEKSLGFTGVANIRDWIAEHRVEVHGLAQREVMHLLFTLHENGPCIQTKHRSDHSWEEKGHVYKTSSKGFHLLLPTTPSPPFAANIKRPPPTKVKVQTQQMLNKLKAALVRFKSDNRVSAVAFKWLHENIDRFEDTKDVPFSWPHDGQLLCERMHEGEIPRGIILPQASAEAMLAREILRSEAEIGHEAQVEQNEESGDDEEDDDAPPIGLRTAPEEQRRLQKEKAAEDAAQYQVDVLSPQHFVIYIPTEKDRNPGAGKRKDNRKFWVGQVYADWVEKENSQRFGVDRATGLVTVHNYTPYNLKNGHVTSNNVAKEYGTYTPEYDQNNNEKWNEVQWDNVLFMCTHLRATDGNPKEISPHPPSYFHLPVYLTKKLNDIFGEKCVRRPSRSLSDPELTGIPTKKRSRKSIERRTADTMQDDDNETHLVEEEEEEQPRARRNKARNKGPD